MSHIDAIITNYTADLSPDAWTQMQEFVRDTIRSRYTGDQRPADVHNALSILSSFADWVLFTAVGDVTPGILQASVIDSYTSFRETEVLPYVAARERKILRTIAGLPNTVELNRPSTTAPVSQPYSEAERGAIRRWAETQPTAQRRTLCGSVVALALGAGLTRYELMHARESDILTLGDGMVGVRVADRVVPVLEEWEDVLAAYAVSNNHDFVIAPQVTSRGSSRLNSLIGRTPSHSWQPSAQRMRNTWLIRCLDAGIPLQTVIDAAGLKTPEMLRRLVPFMSKLEGTQAVRAFRLTGEAAIR